MKKAIFLGLCLMNIVFFLWEFRQRALIPSTKPQTSLATILLVDEMEKARRGAAISAFLDEDAVKLQRLHTERTVEKPIVIRPVAKPKANQKGVAQKTPMMCQEIGPFADQQAAKKWLAGRALQGQMIFKELLTTLDYQVYYPPAKTVELTRIQKMMLNAKGIVDIWMIPSGELKGAYSLGVFSDQARAVVYKNQLAERGVKAEIIARQKGQPRLFVRVKSELKISTPQAEGLTSTACTR